MAQAKAKPRSSGSKSRSSGSNGSSARGKTAGAKRSSNGSKAKSRSKTKASSNGTKSRAARSRPTTRRGASAAKSQAQKAKTATTPDGGLGGIAEKAKTPALAAGAALAGLAGGMALKNGKGRSKGLPKLPTPAVNLSLPKPRRSTAKLVAGAAKQVAKGGYAVGQLTSEVRKVREAVEKNQ